MDISPFKKFVQSVKQGSDQTGASLGTALVKTILSNKLKPDNRADDGTLEAGPDDQNLEGNILDQGFSDLKEPDGVAKVATLWDKLKEKYALTLWDVLKDKQ